MKQYPSIPKEINKDCPVYVLINLTAAIFVLSGMIKKNFISLVAVRN